MGKDRIAFLLFPHAATDIEVSEHLRLIRVNFPNSLVLMSVKKDRRDLLELALDFDFHAVDVYSGDLRLTPRALPLLTHAVSAGVDFTIFNTAMLRYTPAITIQFAREALKYRSRSVIFGNPPLLEPEHIKETKAMIANPLVHKSLMVDIFTSYILCRINQRLLPFTNLMAGLFLMRMHLGNFGDGEIVRALLAMKPYGNSDLLAPLIIWYLSQKELLSYYSVPVPIINLNPMKNNLETRIAEMQYALKLVHSNPEEMAREVFEERACLRPIFTDDYREWFLREVLGLQRENCACGKKHNLIKEQPLKKLPVPEIRRK